MMTFVGWILSSWLAADLIAGFWHWLEDRYFDITWPFIGQYIAKPNELHHEQPTAFLFQTYWKRNWTTIVPAAIAAMLFPSGWLVFLFVSQANEIHAWAHSKGKVSTWVSVLQETGFLQSPLHHGHHHRSPFEIKYCVMSNWLNPLLDHYQVWRALERFVAMATGIEPKPVARQ